MPEQPFSLADLSILLRGGKRYHVAGPVSQEELDAWITDDGPLKGRLLWKKGLWRGKNLTRDEVTVWLPAAWNLIRIQRCPVCATWYAVPQRKGE